MNKYWGIFRDGQMVTCGRVDKWSDPIKIRDTYHKGGEIKYSESSFVPPTEAGTIFGMTWEQIQAKQQKR